jgi:hypothetical protein
LPEVCPYTHETGTFSISATCSTVSSLLVSIDFAPVVIVCDGTHRCTNTRTKFRVMKNVLLGLFRSYRFSNDSTEEVQEVTEARPSAVLDDYVSRV